MKNVFKRAMLGTTGAIIATLFVAAASWSLPGKGHTPRDPERMVAHMAQELELSVEQRDAVSALVSASFAASAEDRERLHTLRDQLHATTVEFDAGSAQAAADEIGAITARLVLRMASTQAEIRGLLSAEQRVELDKMRPQRKGLRSFGRQHEEAANW